MRLFIQVRWSNTPTRAYCICAVKKCFGMKSNFPNNYRISTASHKINTIWSLWCITHRFNTRSIVMVTVAVLFHSLTRAWLCVNRAVALVWAVCVSVYAAVAFASVCYLFTVVQRYVCSSSSSINNSTVCRWNASLLCALLYFFFRRLSLAV